MAGGDWRIGIRSSDPELGDSTARAFSSELVESLDERATRDFSLLREEAAVGRPLTVLYRQGTMVGRFRTIDAALTALRAEIDDVPLTRSSSVVAIEAVRLVDADGSVLLLPAWFVQLRAALERPLAAEGLTWQEGRFFVLPADGGDVSPAIRGVLVAGGYRADDDRQPDLPTPDEVLSTLWYGCANRSTVGAARGVRAVSDFVSSTPLAWVAGQDAAAVLSGVESLGAAAASAGAGAVHRAGGEAS